MPTPHPETLIQLIRCDLFQGTWILVQSQVSNPGNPRSKSVCAKTGWQVTPTLKLMGFCLKIQLLVTLCPRRRNLHFKLAFLIILEQKKVWEKMSPTVPHLVINNNSLWLVTSIRRPALGRSRSSAASDKYSDRYPPSPSPPHHHIGPETSAHLVKPRPHTYRASGNLRNGHCSLCLLPRFA